MQNLMTGPQADEGLLQRVNRLPWFHQMDLGGGIVTPGRGKMADLQAIADVYFRDDIAGKTLLDIGCYDGFFSFEAHRRGARVLATDHFIWQDGRCLEAFLIAKSCLAPDMAYRDIDLNDLSSATVGTFDLVLFGGVFYHLRHPFAVLKQLAVLARETFILETHMDALDYERPAMVFYPGTELNDDPSNWWGPNVACVIAMLKDCGFKDVDYTPNPIHSNRGIFHARR